MQIRVELFGIARKRAGVPAVLLELPAERADLGMVLSELAARCPELRDACLDPPRLKPGFLVYHEERFVTDPRVEVQPNQCLMLLSADAGG